jgi:rhodanese-related sulfurtransferase
MDISTGIIIAVLFLWIAYSKGWILANFEMIDGKMAIDLLKDSKNTVLLDVRTKEEFNTGYFKNAKSFPLQDLMHDISKLDKYKNKKLIIYCASGTRSVSASRILEKNGFTPYNVKGGIIALENAN